MIAIKTIRKFIESNPTDPDAKALGALVLALETDGDISVPKLYGLKFKHFELAIEMLKEWRLDRYYSSKIRLLDIAAQLANLPEEAPKPEEKKTGTDKANKAEKTEVKQVEKKPEPKKPESKNPVEAGVTDPAKAEAPVAVQEPSKA